MTLQQLKLAIIQKVISSSDPQVLETVHQLLSTLRGEQAVNSPPPVAGSVPSILQALAGTPQDGSDAGVNQKDVDDLQQSINEIFGE